MYIIISFYLSAFFPYLIYVSCIHYQDLPPLRHYSKYWRNWTFRTQVIQTMLFWSSCVPCLTWHSCSRSGIPPFGGTSTETCYSFSTSPVFSVLVSAASSSQSCSYEIVPPPASQEWSLCPFSNCYFPVCSIEEPSPFP